MKMNNKINFILSFSFDSSFYSFIVVVATLALPQLLINCSVDFEENFKQLFEVTVVFFYPPHQCASY